MLARWLLSLAVVVPGLAHADALIGNWNIKHLGWNNDKEFAQVRKPTRLFTERPSLQTGGW